MPKHYIQNAAAGYTPSTFHGAWDDTASAVTRAIGFYPSPVEDMGTPKHSGYLPSVSKAETSLSGTWDVCLLRLVSPPLKANITLSQAITTYLFYTESSTNANFVTHMHIWVTQGDGNLERGVLSADHIGGVEWDVNTAAVFRADAPAISSVNALAGDRIVIEFGYRATNTVATSYTGLVHYSSSDNLLDGLGIGPATASRNLGAIYNATIEITDAVDYTVPMRVTAIQAEVAVQSPNDLAPTRFTSLVVEELVTQLAETRLTQLAVEILVRPPGLAPLYNPLPQRCQAIYWANLYDTNGNLLAVFDDFKPLTIEHKINSFSNCTFSIDGQDPRISLFKTDYILEIWRDIGDYKYIEFEGLHRSDQLQYTEGGHWIYTSYSRGFEDFIRRRCLLYPAEYESVYTLKQAPSETVIKEFVNENLGPGANNPLRKVQGTMANFGIETDLARGPTYTAHYSWRNLYEVIQEIALGSSTDFKITRQGNIFTFKCYYPTIGSDKSATLIFSPEYGNMESPSYTLSRTEEVNVVVVLGQGQGNARRTYVGIDAARNDSPWNHCETTHDSRDSEHYQAYVDTANEVLHNLKAKEAFEFKVVQTDASAYGYDYVMGDICTVKFGAISKQKKIIGATINVREGTEDIDIEFTDYPTI